MEKKSQVTIFILIALAILIVFLFLFYLNNQKKQIQIIDLSSDKAAVSNFVENCLKNTALDALYFVASKGGYYENPEPGIDYFFTQVPYYFYINKNISPTLNFVENSLSEYIENNLDFCINNFVDFPGLEITAGNIKAETQIAQDKVFFNLNYPITIKKGDSRIELTDFQAELPVRFADLYNTGLKITEFQMEDSENICLSCLLDTAIDNNVSIKFENYNEDTILFKVLLNTTLIQEEIFEFVFANKYFIK